MKNFSRPLKRLGYYSTCIQYSNPGLPLTISHSHPFYNVSPPRRYLRVSHGTTLHDVTGCCSGSVWHLFCFLILPHNDGGGGGCHTFINVFSLIIILHFSFSTANCTQGSSSPLCCTCVCVSWQWKTCWRNVNILRLGWSALFVLPPCCDAANYTFCLLNQAISE